MNVNLGFQWERQPQAEQFILEILQCAIEESPRIATLSDDLYHQTNTRLFDWLDYVEIPNSKKNIEELTKTGFVEWQHGLYFHPGAQLPRVLLSPAQKKVGVGISVDSIASFLMVRGENRLIMGSEFGNIRTCNFSIENDASLTLIERKGAHSIQPTCEDESTIYGYRHALEQWLIRPRTSIDEDQEMIQTLDLAKKLVDTIGRDRTAWTVLEGERQYWQARNTAGQIQKNRQDRLGMGWANHDHHTFRSSRRHFKQLVELFQLLGFHCREKFYAGDEAGWGAQVMENPECRLVLFLDVDLAPHEIVQDFSKETLPELNKLGTVGLWCALHGDSILKGGMHHLEAQFMFDELKEGLSDLGIKMMHPFSSFPYLKQAFTVGEQWPVAPQRIKTLLEKGRITPEQGEHFLAQGAIGSHLENLQRREGYKGFNQKNVSIIIKETDPRHFS